MTSHSHPQAHRHTRSHGDPPTINQQIHRDWSAQNHLCVNPHKLEKTALLDESDTEDSEEEHLLKSRS